MIRSYLKLLAEIAAGVIMFFAVAYLITAFVISIILLVKGTS